MDLSMTPPAPPLAVVHQRCVMLLKRLDEKYLMTVLEPVGNEHLFSDYFLSDVSSIVFQPGSTLTVLKSFFLILTSSFNLIKKFDFLI